MKKILIFVFVLSLTSVAGYASGPDIRGIAAKEMGIASQSMKSYDTNLDGKKDRFDYYERGKLVTIEYDYDGDGSVDEKDIVENNKIIARNIQKDGKTIFVVNDSVLIDDVKPLPVQ
ncbi:MAG: hypothetical protein HZC17_09140 [Candidatus Omnitrophica bacterium]|nr:hypothetical protein [Candidatus Omnitrophota bacterium]